MASWLSRLFGPARKVLPDGSVDYGDGLRLMNPDPSGWRNLSEYEKATLRWAEHNEQARRSGCPCGRPGTKVRYDHGNNGAVPVEWWTCDEHEGASVWSGTESAMKPRYGRSTPCQGCGYAGGQKSCGGWSGLNGGQPDRWFCPDRAEDADG